MPGLLHSPIMEATEIVRLIATGGFAVALALMVWVMVDLGRLRRHPEFRGPMAGSLRLHLMALGLGTGDLDGPTRRRIGSLRGRILAALIIFALGAIAILVVTGQTPPP